MPPKTKASKTASDEPLKLETLNFYERLGIGQEATTEEIKKSYRKKAAKYHPDKAPPEEREMATTRFQLLNEAHMTLNDIMKRQQYNQYLTNGDAGVAFDPNKNEFNIPWDTGTGWRAKRTNALLILAMLASMFVLILRELRSRWSIHCHAVLSEAADCCGGLLNDCTFLKLSTWESMFTLGMIWYYNIGDDYYMRLLLGIFSLVVTLVYLFENEKHTPRVYHLINVVNFGLFGWGYYYHEGGLVYCWCWSSGLAFAYGTALDAMLGVDWDKAEPKETRQAVNLMTIIVGLVWALEHYWIWRALCGLPLAWLVCMDLSGSKKTPEQLKEATNPLLLIFSSALSFYSCMGWGFFWSVAGCVGLVILEITATNFGPSWLRRVDSAAADKKNEVERKEEGGSAKSGDGRTNRLASKLICAALAAYTARHNEWL